MFGGGFGSFYLVQVAIPMSGRFDLGYCPIHLRNAICRVVPWTFEWAMPVQCLAQGWPESELSSIEAAQCAIR